MRNILSISNSLLAITFNIVFKLNKHFKLNFAAYNLLNHLHRESINVDRYSSGFQSDQIGRRYTVGLSVRF